MLFYNLLFSRVQLSGYTLYLNIKWVCYKDSRRPLSFFLSYILVEICIYFVCIGFKCDGGS